MRAFLNGRIDLTQAEATLDVIQARTATALALAQAQLGGWLASELRRVRELLLGPLAYVTALVDFPEDEVEAQEIDAPLAEGLQTLERLLASADQGMVYRQGARVALVGRPNAGKSSLLNMLLRADRAIVTPIPGTTRDTLEETANLQGIPVVLVDTAGIAETADPVERLGVARSRAALAAADLALLVVDSSAPACDEDAAIAALVEGKPTIVVMNKIDLVSGDRGWGLGGGGWYTTLQPPTPNPYPPHGGGRNLGADWRGARRPGGSDRARAAGRGRAHRRAPDQQPAPPRRAGPRSLEPARRDRESCASCAARSAGDRSYGCAWRDRRGDRRDGRG
jgi:small GTP-binding protein